MSLISSAINSFVQGVSQQTPALRLPSQVEEQLNGYPSLVEGLLKRPPLDYVATISATSFTGAKVHFSSRSVTERYVFVLTDGDLKAYDKATGVEKTVAFPDGKTYLDVVNSPRDSFRLITIADTTFVVNRETTVAMGVATTATQDFQALIAVKQGDYSTRYAVYINGSKEADVVTSDTVQSETRTDDVASKIEAALSASLSASWTTSVRGSSVLVKRTDGAVFNISTWDSKGDDALKVATDKVQRFTDLPDVAPDGYTVEVTGDQTNNFDNYWVTFQANDTSSTVGSEGVWAETVAPGIPYQLDAATMPHILVREADGTFTFKKATWEDRTVGDEESNADPSFVGQEINGVFFFQNRLGFLADDNVILSRTSGYYNFWISTAKDTLDSDPIDVAATYNKVAILNSAIAFDQRLLLFSDQSQWALEGGQILSPKNVSMTLLGEYVADPDVLPTSAGNTVFFATARGAYSAIFEMSVRDDKGRTEASNASEHIPHYVPSNLAKLTTSAGEDCLIALSDNDTSALWVYNWHWSGREKDQASWHKFTLDGAEILDVEFFESDVFVVAVKGGKTILGTINLAPGQLDTGQTFLTLLDYKMDETTVTSAVYDAGADQTTITLPVPLSNPYVVLSGASQGVLKHKGTSGAVSSIVVSGEVTAFFVGEAYTFRATLSEITFRPTKRDGSVSPMVSGRLQLRTLTLLYADTGYFQVTVTPQYRDTYTYTFTGKVVGQGNNIIGAVPISSGAFRVPIQSKSDRVTITLENTSFLPSKFVSAEWEGLISIRAPRV